MNFKHALLMFLGILSGGLGMSKAWDLLSGKITGEYSVHILIMLLMLGASVYFFMRYFKARNAQQRDER